MLVLVLAFIEGACRTALAVLESMGHAVPANFQLSSVHRREIGKILEKNEWYYGFSPTLGWTIIPAGRRLGYRANSQGIRGDEDYTRIPPSDTIRIAVFGDSFVHGSEVANEHTWPAFLERTTSGLEVLNFGVGAYGLDQAFLRYQQDGAPFQAHIVIIGFMSENIRRSVSYFRPFYVPQMRVPRAKPRFVLDESGDVVLLENPLPERSHFQDLLEHERSVVGRLGKRDFYYQTRYREGPLFFLRSVRLLRHLGNRLSGARIIVDGAYNRRSEAFRVTTRILVNFYESALEGGSMPVVVLLPARADLRRFRQEGTKVYEPLLEFLEVQNIPYVDVMGCFARPGHVVEFRPGGHYAPSANRIVALCLRDRLRDAGYLDHRRRIDPFELRSLMSEPPAVRSSPRLGGAPQMGVVRCIINDELSGLGRDRWPPRPALPAPPKAQALSVPANRRLRLDEDENSTPSGRAIRELGPQESIGSAKSDRRFRDASTLGKRVSC